MIVNFADSENIKSNISNFEHFSFSLRLNYDWTLCIPEIKNSSLDNDNETERALFLNSERCAYMFVLN